MGKRGPYSTKLKKIILMILFALASFTLWHMEILYIKGWEGLNWVSGYHWSTLPICLLSSVSVFLVVTDYPVSLKKRDAAFISFTFIILLASCESAKIAIALYHMVLYPPWFPVEIFNVVPAHYAIVSFMLLSTACLSLGLYCSLSSFIRKVSPVVVLLLSISPFFILAVSLVSIKIIPAYGYTDYIHALKYGHVEFWCALLIPLAVFFSAGNN